MAMELNTQQSNDTPGQGPRVNSCLGALCYSYSWGCKDRRGEGVGVGVAQGERTYRAEGREVRF